MDEASTDAVVGNVKPALAPVGTITSGVSTAIAVAAEIAVAATIVTVSTAWVLAVVCGG